MTFASVLARTFVWAVSCCLLMLKGAVAFGAGELATLRKVPPTLLMALRASPADSDGFSGQNHKDHVYYGAEYQRSPNETLVIGAVLKRRDWIDEAFKTIPVTFAHQGPDGNFPGTKPSGAATVEWANGPAFWTYSLLRAFVVLRDSEFWPDYESKAKAWYPNIRKTLEYLRNQKSTLLEKNAKAPNRALMVANAFNFAARLFGDKSYLADAGVHRQLALSLYRPSDGVFIEQGGGDSSYQAVNLLQLLFYHADTPDPSIAEILRKGEAWEAAHVDSNGNISDAGNSRTGGACKEVYFGHCKGINNREVMWMFAEYGAMFDDSRATAMATKIRNQYRLKIYR